MKVTYILNNYTMGALFKTSPVHKVIRKERIDSKKTIVTYEINEREYDFLNLLFAKRGKIEDE